jgi:hypothetical protein
MSEAEIRLYDQKGTKMFFDFDPEIFMRKIAEGLKGSSSPKPLVNKWLKEAINAAIIQNHVLEDKVMKMEVTLDGSETEE